LKVAHYIVYLHH